MFPRDTGRLTLLDTEPDTPERSSILVSPRDGRQSLKITQRYQTSKIAHHPAASSAPPINYTSPTGNSRRVKCFSEDTPVEPPPPVVSPGQTNQESENETSIEKTEFDEQIVSVEPSVSPLSPITQPDDSYIATPESVMLHQGNKLFWRIKRTIDFRIYLASSIDSVIVRTYDSFQNHEFEPIVMSWEKIVTQVHLNEAAISAHQASLDECDYKSPGVQQLEVKEDVHVPKRRASGTRHKSTSDLEAEREKEASMMAEFETELRARVVSFVIGRLEACKSNKTGEILVSIVKRSTDSDIKLDFDELPLGVTKVGRGVSWNKREEEEHVRRKSFEVTQGLQETNYHARRADEKQKALQVALEVVRALRDRQRNDSLSPYRKKFQIGMRKGIFKLHLEKTKLRLSQSPSYQKLITVPFTDVTSDTVAQ